MTKFHFVGIKGSGMSALAQLLHDSGHEVQGSDVATTYFTQQPLERKGIPISLFSANNIKQGLTVIASPAFDDDHVEIVKSRQLGIPFYRYSEFLGQLCEKYTSIAVSGSHGKTSTTGLLSHVLEKMYPLSYLIGDGTGKGSQQSSHFVFEACEYRRHFLHYRPDYAIITNIEFDHPDYFADEEDVLQSFQIFSEQVNKHIVACGDDERILRLDAKVPTVHYGFGEHNDLRAEHLQSSESGVHFRVLWHNEFLGECRLPVYGEHNVLNALAVIGICLLEQIPFEQIKSRLQTFQGVKRRFSEKSWRNNVLIDDYAHHPTEVHATIAAARDKYPDKKLIAIFQPHTFSRTQIFMDSFVNVLQQADHVYLCDIFGSAREQQGQLTVHHMIERLPFSQYINAQTVDQLLEHEHAVLLFMGAGDIQLIQQAFERLAVYEI